LAASAKIGQEITTEQKLPARACAEPQTWRISINFQEGWAIYITGFCRTGDNPVTKGKSRGTIKTRETESVSILSRIRHWAVTIRR
jgi:hypothetical protein